MRKRKKTLGVVVLCSLFTMLFPVTGAAELTQLKHEEANVLVVYTTSRGEMNEKIKQLDMQIGHFTTNVTFKRDRDVQQEDFDGITHLFYYGTVERELPETFRGLSDTFDGTYVAIGSNVEQLGDPFSFVEVQSKAEINELLLVEEEVKASFSLKQLIYKVSVPEQANVLIHALDLQQVYPLFVQEGSRYYFASTYLHDLYAQFFTEGLYDVFGSEHETERPAYIRLEDIHPLVDPDKLFEIGQILKEKDIPYMMAIIPVYTNPVTGEEFHFSDVPKLVKVLQYMQDNGGSIVMHGYTHQYRKTETGEGFEFWDVENNMPISADPEDDVSKRTAEDFPDDESYEAYVSAQKKFERRYIETKLEKGIQELVTHELYPLAFEAPHYTMSQYGYEVVSQFFSTYVGQVQLSDEDWQIMGTNPTITRPSFLNGMLLLPETIGYVEDGSIDGVEQMMEKAEEQLIVRDGIIAGFYHPYLGAKTFKELIERMEEIPHISWIDLKTLDNRVEVPKVSIASGNDEGVTVESTLFFSRYHLSLLMSKAKDHAMWIMAGVAGTAVLLFTFYALRLRALQTRSVARERMMYRGE